MFILLRKKIINFFEFQNGKKISTLGWENWINLNVWRFSHLLQTILQRIRRINLNKHGNGHVNGDTAPIAPELPSKFIDCLSWQSLDTENSTDAPTHPNATTVNQPPSDEPSSDARKNSVVQEQEGKLKFKSDILGSYSHNFALCTDNFSNNVELSIQYLTNTPESNTDRAHSSEDKECKKDDRIGNTTVTVSSGPSESINDATLPIPVHSSVDSKSGVLPTSTVQSKRDDDFGGPTKKMASMALFVTGHDKTTSSIMKTEGKMPSNSAQLEPNSSGDAIKHNEPGNLASL